MTGGAEEERTGGTPGTAFPTGNDSARNNPRRPLYTWGARTRDGGAAKDCAAARDGGEAKDERTGEQSAPLRARKAFLRP